MIKIHVVFLLTFLIFSCKRDTKTTPLPDYTAQLEQEFPYKNLSDPLVFMSEDSSLTETFMFKSKKIFRQKNIKTPETSNLNRLQTTGSITAESTDFTYWVSASGPEYIEHGFSLYNISTNFYSNGLGTQMAGNSSVSFSEKRDLTLFDKEFYDVIEIYDIKNYSGKNDRISKVLVNTKNGILGYYDFKIRKWFYLKP